MYQKDSLSLSLPPYHETFISDFKIMLDSQYCCYAAFFMFLDLEIGVESTYMICISNTHQTMVMVIVI
jgi:hypothetical protein